MTPVWVSSALSTFGARMGLPDFRLNEAGVASATFENGCVLAFEFLRDALHVSVRLPYAADDGTMKRLLSLAHPANRMPFLLRTAYLHRKGMALLTVRLGERQVTPTVLDAVFSGLWDLARRIGGVAA